MPFIGGDTMKHKDWLSIVMIDISEKFPVSFEYLKDSWDWLTYSEFMQCAIGSSIIYYEKAKDIIKALGLIAGTYAFYGKIAALFLQHFWYNLDGDEDLLVCLESEDERYLKFKARALKWANSGIE